MTAALDEARLAVIRADTARVWEATAPTEHKLAWLGGYFGVWMAEGTMTPELALVLGEMRSEVRQAAEQFAKETTA